MQGVWLCFVFFFFFLMIRRPPRSTQGVSSAASDVYKRQKYELSVKKDIRVVKGLQGSSYEFSGKINNALPVNFDQFGMELWEWVFEWKGRAEIQQGNWSKSGMNKTKESGKNMDEVALKDTYLKMVSAKRLVLGSPLNDQIQAQSSQDPVQFLENLSQINLAMPARAVA
eukprot:TRINITY_DN3876_c0_g1_i2.p2 TRINITY_DN3876_c0_g1~~TRINITY_DN3876_c0_g1_i2.p2  ORF type:complete len:170 (+),score=29.48 TRINITY_DN3876_c0_g1_i2:57-566(+)